MNGSNPAMACATRVLCRGKALFNVLWNPVDDDFLSTWQQNRLGSPLSCRRRQWIRVESLPDLFDDSRPDETLDLVHAVIAVAHWHRFLLTTGCAGRATAYYRDAEAPRRIAEEIGALSCAILAENRKRVPRDWIVGFSRVKYGLRRGYGEGVGPIGLEPWPLPHLWVGLDDGEARRIVPLPLLLERSAGPPADRAAPA
jgi:hypothetical protein